jgi:transcriptional regulator with XRE-family HTH domain
LIARRVTIREVARLSGVSVGTVSNVLNGSPKVSEKTRRLVENAIDDLGFTPDTAARSLIARRRHSTAETVSSRYAILLREAGLPPSDQIAADLIAQIVDEGSRGATRHLRLAHRLLIHLAGLPEEGEARWRRVQLTASFIMATRGADAPLIANGVAWLVRSAGSVPEPARAAQLAARAEAWLLEAQRRLARLASRCSARAPDHCCSITAAPWLR